MATFNKENMITLKELAPSLVEIITSKAAQKDLTALVRAFVKIEKKQNKRTAVVQLLSFCEV